MDTTPLQLSEGAAPVDVVQTLSLAPGMYLVENIGLASVSMALHDASASDPASITSGHQLGRRGSATPARVIEVESGNAVYAWSPDGTEIVISDG